jgi:hypothetical protein
MLGLVVGLFIRLYTRLLRIRVVVHPALRGDERPWVYAFWHGRQLALLARPRRRETAVMVSLSKDGQLQSRVMRHHGMIVVRGSSSRRASAGLRGIVRELKRGRDAAFAVDGPKGPVFRAKPGAIVAARASSAHIVPVGVAASRWLVLARTWDRFFIPLPLSRVCIVLGAPLDPCAMGPTDLDRAIESAQSMAMASISTREPRGSAATWTVARAGNTPENRRA